MNAVDVDVLVIGAGAAGLMSGIEAGKRGRQVVVIDHAKKPGEKIRISGGGRCNFTNLNTSPDRYISKNPRYCVSALARYTPQDFIDLVERYGIAYHEKTLGQLFCDGSAQQIIKMLVEECRRAKVQVRLQTDVEEVKKTGTHFEIRTSTGIIRSTALVVACGGLSIPKMGATGLGYEIARQFGLGIVPMQPALVPFTLTEAQLSQWSTLSGVSAQAEVQCEKQQFREGLLFTHRGLSGPVMLQISSYWQPGATLRVNMAPDTDVAAMLIEAKRTEPRREAVDFLHSILPKRLGQRIADQHLSANGSARLADIPDRQLAVLGLAVNDWRLKPNGTEGYRTAEVTLGGVHTDELSSKTMESKKVPG